MDTEVNTITIPANTSINYIVPVGYSHSELGYAAHAEGEGTQALKRDSHSEGRYTIAASINQHVEGRYNEIDEDNKYAHIIGNGESKNQRSNAHTVDWDGNAYYQGTVEAESIILRSPGGKKFKITIDDDGNLSTKIIEEVSNNG